MTGDIVTGQRQLHAIEVRFRTPKFTAVIVWPADDKVGCCRLINSKRTWLTARAGDACMLQREGSKEPERVFIREVLLYLVDPADWNGVRVTTAEDWLAAPDSSD